MANKISEYELLYGIAKRLQILDEDGTGVLAEWRPASGPTPANTVVHLSDGRSVRLVNLMGLSEAQLMAPRNPPQPALGSGLPSVLPGWGLSAADTMLVYRKLGRVPSEALLAQVGASEAPEPSEPAETSDSEKKPARAAPVSTSKA